MRKQEWYHDYLKEEDADPVAFVGSFTEASPVNEVAADMRRVFKIDAVRSQVRDNDDFFRLLVARAEESGVLVLRTSIVGHNTHWPLDPDEFQGFANADDLALLVFVNQNDYRSAQIFTLLHELAHIWIGVSGVSNPDYLDRPITDDALHQRRADAIAAEALVPGADLNLRWANYPDLDGALSELRRHYRVSVFVILRRAFDLGKLSLTAYGSKYDDLRSQIKPKPKGGGGGYSSLFSRNSYTVATAVLHSAAQGKIAPTQGAERLNVRPKTLYSAGMRNIAIVHMARTLSLELAPSGITVNVIHPGGTRTERTSDEEAARIAGGNMTCRAVDARDVADVAIFLASARAWSISGEVIGGGGGEPSRSLFLELRL